MKTIFAISGSLRSGSSNHNILRYLKSVVPVDVNYIIYDGLATIPPFDPGLDNETPPEAVAELRKLLAEADGVIICTPEYAFGVPGQFKNALDWTASSGSFDNKPTALITASTGGENAHTALLKILGAINADIADGSALLISYIRSKMDNSGNVIDEETIKQLRSCLKSFTDHLE